MPSKLLLKIRRESGETDGTSSLCEPESETLKVKTMDGDVALLAVIKAFIK